MVEGTAVDAPAIRLRSLTKAFGNLKAVDDLDLDIRPGEFFSMLGPSGSGKTTVLRLIAGFEQPTSGTIELFGDDVTKRAPFDRDVNTVFQDYALFPHMNVIDNVAYGLRVRGMGRAERRKRALEALGIRPAREVRDPQAVAALRRSAAARRPRPRDRRRAEGAAARRAARRPRPQAAAGDAGRAQGDAARARHHLHLRHARPGGGPHAERPHRGVQRGPHRAARHAAGDLRAPAVAVRRRLRGDLEPVRRGRGEADAEARPARSRCAPRRSPSSTSAAGHSQGSVSLSGKVSEVIYLGTSTRLLVDLDGGYRLNVLEQNVSGSGRHHDRRGSTVVASWSPADIVPLTPRLLNTASSMNTEKRRTE